MIDFFNSPGTYTLETIALNLFGIVSRQLFLTSDFFLNNNNAAQMENIMTAAAGPSDFPSFKHHTTCVQAGDPLLF